MKTSTQMVTTEKTHLEGRVNDYLRRPYARVVTPEADGTFRAEVIEFPGCLATGATAAKALKKLEDVAESWLLAVLERQQPVPEPFDAASEFSGKLVLRIPRSLHRKAAWAAEREGVSLNQYISTGLAEAVGEQRSSRKLFAGFAHAHIKQWSSFAAPPRSFQPTTFLPLTIDLIEAKVDA